MQADETAAQSSAALRHDTAPVCNAVTANLKGAGAQTEHTQGKSKSGQATSPQSQRNSRACRGCGASGHTFKSVSYPATGKSVVQPLWQAQPLCESVAYGRLKTRRSILMQCAHCVSGHSIKITTRHT